VLILKWTIAVTGGTVLSSTVWVMQIKSQRETG